MCIIIDANLAARVFNVPTPPEFKPLMNWLRSEKGMLVYGGKNTRELFFIGGARRAIRELRRSGKAREIAKIDYEQSRIESRFSFVSDDPHVIALARISNARTLCSHDNDLHTDFKNPRLVPKPRGKIYQDESHARTLVHTRQCPFQQETRTTD